MSTNKSQQKSMQTPPVLPQGHRPRCTSASAPVPPLTHSCSAIEDQCVEQVALRISNIKLCHIVFQITLFTSLSFQKKKQCKRYSNSTQFKFFFSSLNFPKEEFQKQERVWSKAAIPRGSRGARQSISGAFFCPESLWQGHSNVEDPGNSVLRKPSELKHPG